METYEAMRQFADSWGLLGMFVVFLMAVFFAFRPGGKASAEQAAQIPFSDVSPVSAKSSDDRNENSYRHPTPVLRKE